MDLPIRQILRMIIENELEQHQIPSAAYTNQQGEKVKEDEQFEIILRPLLDLAVEFTNFYEERPVTDKQLHGSEMLGQINLASIAAKANVSLTDRRVVLSEDASVSVDGGAVNGLKAATKGRPDRFRKSLSTDDIDSYNATNEWMMGRPMAKNIGLHQPKEYERVMSGDVLEAVDSSSTGTTGYSVC